MLEQALDIAHPAFSMANDWIRKLKVAPEGHWGHEYIDKKYVKGREENNQAFVFRVLLNHKKPQLLASYRAYFGEVNSKQLELTKRYVVFKFTNKETGVVKHRQFFSNNGWNNADNVEVFEYFLPGEYSFYTIARREFRGGRSGGIYKTIDIKL